MSVKFAPTRDNPYLFILNTELGTRVDFEKFLSIAPRNYLFLNESPLPMKDVRATFDWLAAKLGDGKTISRSLVASFSLAAVKKHTVYRKFEPEPDNPFAFLLNVPNDMLTFKDFLSVAPRDFLEEDGVRIPRRRLRDIFHRVCKMLGNGTVIYRDTVAAFSLSAMIKIGRLLSKNPSKNLSKGSKCYRDISCGDNSKSSSQCGCFKAGVAVLCDGWCSKSYCTEEPMVCCSGTKIT
jgi:hypothetical protein